MEVNSQVLQDGCSRYGATNPVSRAGSEAALYEVIVEGHKHLLRFSPVEKDDTQRFTARWAFVQYLAESGVGVAQQVSSYGGNLIEWIDDPGGKFRWALVCVEWLDGHNLDPNTLSAAPVSVLRNWGQLMGKMHTLTKAYPQTPHLGGWMEESQSFLDWCEDEYVSDKWQAMIRRLETLPMDRDSYGLVHNDLHYANILVSGETVSVVDFDVSGYHWFMCDIAVAMQGVLWTSKNGVVRDQKRWLNVYQTFMEGYSSANTLDPMWETHLETFLEYRRLLLYTVFSHEWKNPGTWQKDRLNVWRGGIIGDVEVLTT